jgi:hypothetical protein
MNSLNEKIAKNLINTTGLLKLNPFENSRRRAIVEIRSVLIKILRDYQEMTLYEIADFFTYHNKKMEHSSVLYSLNNYDIYCNYNPMLKVWHDFVVNALFGSTDYHMSLISKRKVLKNKIDCLNEQNLDELFMYAEALSSEQIK